MEIPQKTVTNVPSEEVDYVRATTIGTIKSYEDFLNEHPYGQFTFEARSQLEVLYLEKTITENTLEAHEAFLEKYPNGELSEQVRKELPAFAKVKIDAPLSIRPFSIGKGGVNSRNLRWDYAIKFRELNGVEVVFNKMRMRIYSKNGGVWGDNNFEDIYLLHLGENGNIKVIGNGSNKYVSFVTGWERCWTGGCKCHFCGAKMVLKFKGIDENGHQLVIETDFLLN